MRWLLLCLVPLACHGPQQGLPRVMVWAWDRPEDLRFLTEHSGHSDPADVGVAYLAATIDLAGEHVSLRRRHGALQLAPGTVRLPVVRIEPDLRAAPTLSDAQRGLVVAMLRAELERAGLGRIQLDFEASASQRPFYRALLGELRAAVGAQVTISVTALGSWCVGDRWMRDLPVDEIVPMFYRLGPDGAAMRASLAGGNDVAPECRAAHGFITDEPTVPPPTPRRVYLFSPRPWRAESFAKLAAMLKGRS